MVYLTGNLDILLQNRDDETTWPPDTSPAGSRAGDGRGGVAQANVGQVQGRDRSRMAQDRW